MKNNYNDLFVWQDFGPTGGLWLTDHTGLIAENAAIG